MPKKEFVDHKILGQKLELFFISPFSPGMIFWLPNGVVLFNLIIDDLRKTLTGLGYQEIKTPTLFNTELFRQSGHVENFRDKMFFAGGGKELSAKNKLLKEGILNWTIKPMNCPEAMLVFNSKMRSYRDLPLRLAEFGQVHRYEQAGEVNGLLRTRQITQDDAHIFATAEQIEAEVENLIDLTLETYKKYGFNKYRLELSTRPQKSIGTDEQWQNAEQALSNALKNKKMKYKENPGDGAFYGPKIDFHIEDAHKRSWQLSTIQLDFAMPEKLEVNYIDATGKKQHPVIIHRAILGSIERFIAILLEHYAGALPVWLAPVQARLIPISERHLNYARRVSKELWEKGARVEIDSRNETTSKKIRDLELEKISFGLVVGDREEKNKKVAVRSREKGDIGAKNLTDLIKMLQ